jgi:hypothetical protein
MDGYMNTPSISQDYQRHCGTTTNGEDPLPKVGWLDVVNAALHAGASEADKSTAGPTPTAAHSGATTKNTSRKGAKSGRDKSDWVKVRAGSKKCSVNGKKPSWSELAERSSSWH